MNECEVKIHSKSVAMKMIDNTHSYRCVFSVINKPYTTVDGDLQLSSNDNSFSEPFVHKLNSKLSRKTVLNGVNFLSCSARISFYQQHIVKRTAPSACKILRWISFDKSTVSILATSYARHLSFNLLDILVQMLNFAKFFLTKLHN